MKPDTVLGDHDGRPSHPPRVDRGATAALQAPVRSMARPALFEACVDGRCPIEDTLNLLTGRWKILILWWLQAGELRFGELRRRIPKVSPKMLTQQLRQMEEEGLIAREVFAQVPPKVIYSLTARGESLRPVLQSLYDWSVGQPPR
jgi:DNA-binding HxlR family transcriptional regulator